MKDNWRVYYLRYLPPKQNGLGKIVFVMACEEEMSIERFRELYPKLFKKPGFYNILYTDHDSVYIEPEDKKK